MIKKENAKSTMDILEMARQLGMALASSEELQKYREAELNYLNDTEASRLTKNFQQKQQALGEMMSSEGMDTAVLEEMMEAVKKADVEMKALPVIASFYKAGEVFNHLMHQINQILKFYCMDKDIQEDGCHEGNCGGCSKGCK